MDEKCRLVEKTFSEVDLVLLASHVCHGDACGLDLVGPAHHSKLADMAFVSAVYRRSQMGVNVDSLDKRSYRTKGEMK